MQEEEVAVLVRKVQRKKRKSRQSSLKQLTKAFHIRFMILFRVFQIRMKAG